MRSKKILHLIAGLNTGGAEMTLFKLLSKMDRNLFESEVISLTNIGPVGKKIQEIGIPVASLEFNRRFPNPYKFYKLIEKIKKSNSDLIQTWMYHADLIAGVAARLAGSLPIIWNVRHSNFAVGNTALSTKIVVKLCAYLSRWLPTRIIGNSQVAGKLHMKLGYPDHKMHIIPNGFDLDLFKPDPEAYQSVRRQLNIPSDSILIGLVGRFHPQKGHLNFIKAASKLVRESRHVYFALCGDEIAWENSMLRKWIEDAQLQSHFFLLGRRDDIPQITAAFDIAVSSSLFGEGFSNSIGEAMSCGVPCVVTDVGASAVIVGDTGIVVPPADPEQLSEGLGHMIQMGKEQRFHLGQRARERVRENFSLPLVVRNYESLYKKTLENHERLSSITTN